MNQIYSLFKLDVRQMLLDKAAVEPKFATTHEATLKTIAKHVYAENEASCPCCLASFAAQAPQASADAKTEILPIA